MGTIPPVARVFINRVALTPDSPICPERGVFTVVDGWATVQRTGCFANAPLTIAPEPPQIAQLQICYRSLTDYYILSAHYLDTVGDTLEAVVLGAAGRNCGGVAVCELRAISAQGQKLGVRNRPMWAGQRAAARH